MASCAHLYFRVLMCLLLVSIFGGGTTSALAATYDFPARSSVARLVYYKTTDLGGGKKVRQPVFTQAVGRVVLPDAATLEVILSFDGLQSLQSLEQLGRAQIIKFDAAKLDFEDKHLPILRKFSPLVNLNLDQTLITDKGLPDVAACPGIVNLRVSGTDINGSGFSELNKLSNLLVLNISSLGLKPGNLAKLKPILPRLTDLNLSRTALTREDAPCLDLLKSIHNLDLSCNKNVDDSWISHIKRLTTLATLSINDTSITDRSLPSLLRLPHLHEIYVRAREFWVSSPPKPKIGQVRIVDVASQSIAPVEIFRPLH